MALAKDLMGVGLPDQAAVRMGYVPGTAVGAGTTNADAFQLLKDATFLSVTGAAASGFKLPANAELFCPYVIANIDANAKLIYPGTGMSINGDTATTGTSPIVARGTNIYWRTSPTTWVGLVGAAG